MYKDVLSVRLLALKFAHALNVKVIYLTCHRFQAPTS